MSERKPEFHWMKHTETGRSVLVKLNLDRSRYCVEYDLAALVDSKAEPNTPISVFHRHYGACPEGAPLVGWMAVRVMQELRTPDGVVVPGSPQETLVTAIRAARDVVHAAKCTERECCDACALATEAIGE